MKIAVAGKGGSGKTTLAGTLARALGRRGQAVLAIDADTNPNLAITLGLPPSGY
jgi:CO dehydrogenase maturation factor